RKGCSHPGRGEASTKMKPFAALIFFLFNRFRSSTLGSPVKQKNPTFVGLYFGWRRGRDSNPRYAQHVYTLSRRAHSTTLTPLQVGCKSKRLYPYFKCKCQYGERLQTIDTPIAGAPACCSALRRIP